MICIRFKKRKKKYAKYFYKKIKCKVFKTKPKKLLLSIEIIFVTYLQEEVLTF